MPMNVVGSLAPTPKSRFAITRVRKHFGGQSLLSTLRFEIGLPLWKTTAGKPERRLSARSFLEDEFARLSDKEL